MKNKKGFTLVELIAIIIVIGIIIGIIAPTAIKLIEKSKANSFREGLRSIIRSAEIYMEENDLKTLPEEGIYLQDNDLDIDYADGYTGIIKYINGEIVLQNIGNGTYCGSGSKDTLSVSGFTEDCVVVKPEPQCYLMGTTDTAGDTIIGYDYENENCSSMELSIPATVNEVPVKYIADGAFLDSYEYALGVGYYDTTPLGGPGIFPVMELLENLSYMGVTPFEMVYMSNLPPITKMCITTSMEEATVPINYMMSSGGYIFCTLMFSDGLSSYQAQGIGITKVDFSNATNLVKIGNSAFANNFIIGTVDLSGATNLTEIASNAFGYNQIESLKLPSSLVTIGSSAFVGNQIQTISIPASVTTIGDYAFGDNNWNSVTIGANSTNKEDRFNDNWEVIGWPLGLRPDESISDPVNYALTTSANSFAYIKGYYIVNVQTSGNYKLEVWGGSGSNGASNDPSTYTYPSYSGGYTSGTVYLSVGTTIYVYIGGAGNDIKGGYNGGGDSISPDGDCEDNGGGGGATDIRLVGGDWNAQSSLLSRIIVAGGGGGGRANAPSTNAGTEIGLAGSQTQSGVATDNQNSWNEDITCDIAGGFGYGGSENSSDDNPGGGGGWYGGCSGYDAMGGGGSNYALTSESVKPSGYTPTSTYYLSSVVSIAGNASMPTYDGLSTMNGNTGNGYAKITYIG